MEVTQNNQKKYIILLGFLSFLLIPFTFYRTVSAQNLGTVIVGGVVYGPIIQINCSSNPCNSYYDQNTQSNISGNNNLIDPYSYRNRDLDYRNYYSYNWAKSSNSSGGAPAWGDPGPAW